MYMFPGLSSAFVANCPKAVEEDPGNEVSGLEHTYIHVALFRECKYIYTRGEPSWYLFSCDHDVIKTEPHFLEQKGSILCIVQPTIR